MTFSAFCGEILLGMASNFMKFHTSGAAGLRSGQFNQKKIFIQGLISDFRKQMKINSRAERHHYSMFNVGRSMFDVHLSNQGVKGSGFRAPISHKATKSLSH
jgi:hypothetical protein